MLTQTADRVALVVGRVDVETEENGGATVHDREERGDVVDFLTRI